MKPPSDQSRGQDQNRRTGHPLLGRGHCRYNGSCKHGTGGRGIKVSSAPSLFTSVVCHRADGVHPGYRIGSAWISSPKREIQSSEGITVILLCLAAVWVTVLVFNIERWVSFYSLARTGIGRTEIGYVYNLLLDSCISLVILGVPAACIGAVLPLMIRAFSREGLPLGRRVGSLLTWNTLGAVGGVLLTGFVPNACPAGLRDGILALALTLLALAMDPTRVATAFGSPAGDARWCAASLCSVMKGGSMRSGSCFPDLGYKIRSGRHGAEEEARGDPILRRRARRNRFCGKNRRNRGPSHSWG